MIKPQIPKKLFKFQARILFFLLLTLPAWAQTSKNSFEIGLDALSTGYVNSLQDRYFKNNAFNTFSGVFLRYNMPRWGIRVGAYRDKYVAGVEPHFSQYNLNYDKFVAFSIGTQTPVLRSRSWLYVFQDLRYSHQLERGNFLVAFRLMLLNLKIQKTA